MSGESANAVGPGRVEAVKLWALCKRAPVLVFGGGALAADCSWVGVGKAAGVPWDLTLTIANVALAVIIIALVAVYLIALVVLFREERKP